MMHVTSSHEALARLPTFPRSAPALFGNPRFVYVSPWAGTRPAAAAAASSALSGGSSLLPAPYGLAFIAPGTSDPLHVERGSLPGPLWRS